MANYIATANLNEPNLPRSGLLEQGIQADVVVTDISLIGWLVLNYENAASFLTSLQS